MLTEALAASPALTGALEEFGSTERPLFDRIRSLWERTAEPSARPYLVLFFEVYAAALRDPERYETFLSTVVGRWLDLLVPMLEAQGLSRTVAETRATELLALHHGCALDLLATGDRKRIAAAYLSRIRELEATAAPGA